jgi:hypothetical protein
MAIMRAARSASGRPRRSATPCSVTIKPAALRGVQTGPLSVATIRLAGPAVDGSMVTGTPPGRTRP